MKVSICDICVQDNKVGFAKYRLRLKSSVMSMGLDLCEKHRGYGKGQTSDEVMKKYTKLIHIPKPILRTDLLFEENLK